MNFLHYLLQVNLYLVLFYGFYRVLLGGETFHQANRAYLVAGAALALFIPVWHSEWVQGWFVTERVHAVVYAFYDPGLLIVRPVAARPGLTWGQVVALGYGLGALAALGRFSAQAAQLGRLLRRRSLKKDDRGAFSFFNFLFISPELKRQTAILAHERVHVRQLHSADVLLMELLAVVCWFNPVVYAYRRSLRNLHEFIADEVASRYAANKADYALLLFNQQLGVNGPLHPLTNPFFTQSGLRRRIVMLHKPRSRRAALLKYGLSAPLFGLMLVLSSAGVSRHEALRRVETVLTSEAEVLPAAPPALPLPLTDPAVDLPKVVFLSPALKREMARKDTIDPIFTIAERQPRFPGGIKALLRFFAQNIRYPQAAQNNRVEGNVFLTFIIEKNGAISNVQVLKGIGHGCDEEAIRVLHLMPPWKPARQDGNIVRSRFNLPVSFRLDTHASKQPIDKNLIKEALRSKPTPRHGRTYNGQSLTVQHLLEELNTSRVRFHQETFDMPSAIFLNGKKYLNSPENLNQIDSELADNKRYYIFSVVTVNFGPEDERARVIIRTNQPSDGLEELRASLKIYLSGVAAGNKK